MKKLSTAALMIALLATPALAAAENAPAPAREAVSVTVSTQGLDLSSPADQLRLRARLKRAINAACAPSRDAYAAELVPDRQCFQEMAMNAESKMQMVAHAGYTRSAASAISPSSAKD